MHRWFLALAFLCCCSPAFGQTVCTDGSTSFGVGSLHVERRRPSTTASTVASFQKQGWALQQVIGPVTENGLEYRYLLFACPEPPPPPPPPPPPVAVDCVVSDWSEWSAFMPVSATQEARTRTRSILTAPENGGAACPTTSETETQPIPPPEPPPDPNDPPPLPPDPPPDSGTAPVPVLQWVSGLNPAVAVVLSTTGTHAATGDSIAAYALSWGDGSAAITGAGLPPATLSHTFSTVGAYAIELSVTSAAGLTASSAVTLTIAPPPVLDVTVRTGHPRLHFTPERLPQWRAWLAGPWKSSWQNTVNAVGKLTPAKQPGLFADFYALVCLGGTVPGINYGTGKTVETYCDAGVQALMAQIALGPLASGLLSDVNHPFHGSDAVAESVARAYDWLFSYPGFSGEQKQAVALWLAHLDYQLFEEKLSDGKTRMRRIGPFDFMGGSPGSEFHHPMYYGLAFYGDGYADDAAVRMIASFGPHWLNGSWLDALNYESRGDFGQRVLGGYGNWYIVRPLLMMHAWKTATGVDYINGPTTLLPATWAKNFVTTQIALQKPHKPGWLVPVGQGGVDAPMAKDVLGMLSGVLTGPEAGWAAYLAGPVRINTPSYAVQILTMANPEVLPVAPPTKTWFSDAYGLLSINDAEQTQMIFGVPPWKLKGHTWATQGGGPLFAIPQGGPILTVKGQPILVWHKGATRNAAPRTYGQSTMRFYPDWKGAPATDTSALIGGIGNGQAITALRVQTIKASEAIGGISAWTPGHAVADLSQWYDPALVTTFTRTFDWTPTSLTIRDATTVKPTFTRTDAGHEGEMTTVQGWSRWYTGQRPSINGVPVADGVTEFATVPPTVTLGPVTWTIAAPTGTTLRIDGGPMRRWVNDRWEVSAVAADNTAANDAGGYLEAGEWTITLIAPGGGAWQHTFSW